MDRATDDARGGISRGETSRADAFRRDPDRGDDWRAGDSRPGDLRGADPVRGPWRDDDGRGGEPRGEAWRGSRREADPFEQRLDRWVSAGRQFVDGVSGARPGSRSGPRSPGARGRGALGSFRPADLGRWVEDRLDRLLEDDGDDWREPWQEAPAMAPAARRPLEAISRRGGGRAPMPPPMSPPVPPQRSLQTPPQSPPPVPAAGAVAPPAAAAAPEDWPDDDSFMVPRWQRQSAPPRRPADPLDPRASSPQPSPPPARPLPRSTRRR